MTVTISGQFPLDPKRCPGILTATHLNFIQQMPVTACITVTVTLEEYKKEKKTETGPPE